MEPDLSASITKHPHPFHLHEHERAGSPARSSPRPSVAHPSSSAHSVSAQDKGKKAVSTGIEAHAEDGEQPVSRHPSQATDVESASGNARLPTSNDPYGLAQGLKTDEQIDAIRANSSRKRDAPPGGQRSFKPAGLRSKIQAKNVESFYRNQNETIERLLKSVDDHVAEARQTENDEELRVKIAVWGSFAANIILSVLQVYAAASSGSLSLFTTMADSIFDPLSNLMLILANRAVTRVDPNRFPSGKARLETAGNISFSFIMTSVSLILICFSCEELATTADGTVSTFHLPSVIAVAVAFATKFALFLYCWGIKDRYSQVDILWQDHRNDLFINGFGILTSVGGSKLAWWIDPMGAILLSLLISFIWLRTAFMEFMLLVGVVADVETQQLLTYVCLTHSPAVLGIDTVRVYHSGPRLIAEVDIVMDPNSTLKDTHDVAEELQFKLENLPDIERAYVHVDYETDHKPEHFYKKDL